MDSAAAKRRLVARAVRVGSPEVIEVSCHELAPLARGEVLVQVEAAGLNHVETLVRSGAYSIQWKFPYGVGFEGAGTVVAAGPDVSVLPGARVCWTAVFGSCATLVAAPAQMLAPLPDTTSFETGASLAHAGVTAAGLVRHCPLPQGSHAVVWGAAGAVGRVLVALLAGRGISVVGIASGSRVDAVRRLGAEHVVDRTGDNVVEAVRDYTRGIGANAVFDPVGAATYETSLQLLAPRGYLVNYGQLSGELPTIHLEPLMEAGSVFVTKYGPRAGLVAADQLSTFISETLALAATRPVETDIAARFPLDHVVDAYRLLESSPQGKVLVMPQQHDA